MWLYRTLLLSGLLLISFANNAQSTPIDSLDSYEFQSTLADEKDNKGNNQPQHRGSGR